MTDRELLEAAARVAGLDFPSYTDCIKDFDSPHRNGPALYASIEANSWNALDDDGDALRLAVVLRLELLIDENSTAAVKRGAAFAREPHGADPAAATRKAIVRAAAQIEEPK